MFARWLFRLLDSDLTIGWENGCGPAHSSEIERDLLLNDAVYGTELADRINEARGEGEEPAAYCTRMAQLLLSTLNIPALGPGAIDLTIEASGAPTCVQMGVQVLKPA